MHCRTFAEFRAKGAFYLRAASAENTDKIATTGMDPEFMGRAAAGAIRKVRKIPQPPQRKFRSRRREAAFAGIPASRRHMQRSTIPDKDLSS